MPVGSAYLHPLPTGPSQQEEGGKPKVELSFFRCVEFALLLLFFKYIYIELIR